MQTNSKFYLGRMFDTGTNSLSGQPVHYDPSDLTTHAVIIGMTGSGKTGLGIILLEEAALSGVPALIIDPKGDLTNTLLHFPRLLPEDFQKWINFDEARRSGITPEQAAELTARQWQEGLAEWDLGPEQVEALAEAAQWAVYTPGSDTGLPVSILASFKAPSLSWDDHRELLREKISATVTALLGLLGINDVDPVRSREHILLANIFEGAWSQGKDLDLGEMILQTQNPPFTKLGVFDVNTFFPEKDRFDLAMLLNNMLAAPTFQSWIEGQPLDIPSLLWTPDGRPRHSVFYLAHLSETERMFFITLLYSAVETWMRTQAGSATLRALLYFDEIYGYLPPVGNPPSKVLLLRMLKQARAYGFGQVLATQNPVDLDYKALSNAGTWFIGKLQTEQDKQRLIDGLQGAAGASLDRGAYDRLISGLGKRVFLMHNVHNAQPILFGTRWTMNYLPGPLTRAQIRDLNRLVEPGISPSGRSGSGAAITGKSAFQKTPASTPISPAEAASPGQEPAPPTLPGSVTRPAVPAGVAEYFLPNNMTFTQAFQAAGMPYPQEAFSPGLIYRPVLLAQATVRFLNRKYNLDYELQLTALVDNIDRPSHPQWQDFQSQPIHPTQLDGRPDPQARFAPLEAPLTDAKILGALQKDFLDWAYRRSQIMVRASETLKIYAGPDTSPAAFRREVSEAARAGRDAEAKKVSDGYEKKISTLKMKLTREERELSEDETEFSQRRMEELGTHAENFLGLFGGRKSSRRLSSSLTKRRLTEQAKAEIEESKDAIDDLEAQIASLEQEKTQVLQEVNERWGELANQLTEIPVTPYKKDVLLDLFGVAWAPYHIIQSGDDQIELPGFSIPVQNPYQEAL